MLKFIVLMSEVMSQSSSLCNTSVPDDDSVNRGANRQMCFDEMGSQGSRTNTGEGVGIRTREVERSESRNAGSTEKGEGSGVDVGQGAASEGMKEEIKGMNAG